MVLDMVLYVVSFTTSAMSTFVACVCLHWAWLLLYTFLSRKALLLSSFLAVRVVRYFT